MDQPGTPTSTERSAESAPLPPPPPAAAAPARDSGAPAWQPVPPVPGQLSPGWRIATAVTWGLVFVCFIAVWKTSRELGLNTWWLGPVGEPARWWVSMVPFIAPVAVIMLAVNNAKGIPWFGLGASAVCAIVALLDTARVPRLAVVELVIAGAGAMASLGAMSGRYRPAEPRR